MTRAEQALARRWRSVLLACVLVALSGAVLIIWTRINTATARADQLAQEADLRGTAVSTLAGDVRTLRAQVQAAGGTPAAPDPARAVSNLPDRAAVPVPVPGPPGPQGDAGVPGGTGRQGPAGPSGTPGPEGSPGVSGEAGPPGPAGKDGADGKDGAAGPQGDVGPAGPQGDAGPAGRDGQTCPTGYSLQPAVDDPYALVCRQDGAPSPDPTTPSSPPALPTERRRT
jgi:outer membrane murein-binding lipoprotein Lpp